MTIRVNWRKVNITEDPEYQEYQLQVMSPWKGRATLKVWLDYMGVYRAALVAVKDLSRSVTTIENAKDMMDARRKAHTWAITKVKRKKG